MTQEKYLLLLKRRKNTSSSEMGSNSDGLMDILCNVVGVMALVTALTGIFAASSAVNIIAPMTQKTKRDYTVFKISSKGLWNLTPAINLMTMYDRQRVADVDTCSKLKDLDSQSCMSNLEGWKKESTLGSYSIYVDHSQGLIKINDPPLITSKQLIANKKMLGDIFSDLSKNNKAAFVLLENDGYANYRAFKQAASQYKVPIGWEPWFKGDPIYFWGNAGRELSVQ